MLRTIHTRQAAPGPTQRQKNRQAAASPEVGLARNTLPPSRGTECSLPPPPRQVSDGTALVPYMAAAAVRRFNHTTSHRKPPPGALQPSLVLTYHGQARPINVRNHEAFHVRKVCTVESSFGKRSRRILLCLVLRRPGVRTSGGCIAGVVNSGRPWTWRRQGGQCRLGAAGLSRPPEGNGDAGSERLHVVPPPCSSTTTFLPDLTAASNTACECLTPLSRGSLQGEAGGNAWWGYGRDSSGVVNSYWIGGKTSRELGNELTWL